MKTIQNILNKLFPRQIWLQIFVVLVFLVVVPLVLLGLLLINTSQNSIRTTVLRDHKEVATHATGAVKEHVRGAQETMTLTASILGALHADPWRQETVFVELALRNPAFERVSTIDRNGHETATSNLGSPLRDFSDHVGFKTAIQNQRYMSEVRISPEHEPFVELYEPILRFGRVSGVLVAKFNLRSVWNIIDGIRFGTSGHAYLVDRERRIIAHPDKKFVLKTLGADLTEPIDQHNSSLEEFDPKEWLLSSAIIPELSWTLVILQPKSEAYAFIGIMRDQSWILILFSILATIVISLFLSKLMSRPVHTLIRATEHVAEKDYDFRLRIARRDEFGKLFHAFNQMIARIKEARRMEKLSTIGSAATAIAHELKNSLVAVNTYIQLLPERHQDKEFIEDFSRTVPQELNSWKNMLQNMTDYSKFLQFSKHDVNINALIKDVATLAHQRAKQKGIDFEMHMDQSLPCIIGNEAKLKQVFLNLINNALEATPEGGKVSFSTDLVGTPDMPKSSHVRVVVEDTGEGLSPEQLEHVFEPFYTTKNDGLGLGLSISSEIVKLHGGEIDVKSQKKKGAAFTVKIPTTV